MGLADEQWLEDELDNEDMDLADLNEPDDLSGFDYCVNC